MADWWRAIRADLEKRFGDFDGAAPPELESRDQPPLWSQLAGRGSVRRFEETPPSLDLLRALAALALSAPTKSDLQQRDVILATDPSVLSDLKDLVADQEWIAGAPAMAVFCGNHRRQRQVHELRGRGFANDHLDAFFNASVDAAIAMTAFVLAAEAAGLGTCPISAIRNRAQEASDLLGLPEHVFPIAGVAVGWPSRNGRISYRVPLALTLHENRYAEGDVGEAIASYDRRRAEAQPYARQREPERFGEAATYGWSEDKARQYSSPERADFGDFIRRKGFSLK